MGEGALIDSGLKTMDGKWIGKQDVKNEQDFLKNPQAQERAFADYMARTETYLQKNGSMKSIGKTFTGKKGVGIQITKPGLLAAAHRRGQGAVKDYLKFQNENGWSSDFSKEPDPDKRTIHEQVETRLRLFQSNRYRQLPLKIIGTTAGGQSIMENFAVAGSLSIRDKLGMPYVSGQAGYFITAQLNETCPKKLPAPSN